MPHPRRALQALGLSISVALCLAALTPVPAQAVESFLIEKQTFAELGIEEETTHAFIEGESAGFLSEIFNIQFKCTEMDASEGKLLLGGIGEGKFLFLSCDVLEGFTPFAKLPCTTEDISFIYLSLIKLHGGKTYLLFEPRPPNTVFSSIKLSGEECPFPKEIVLKGSMAVELAGEASTQSLTSVNPETAKLLGDELKLSTHPTVFKGTIGMLLSGKYTNKKWGGI